MEFLLSAEQLEIQDTVKRFLDKKCESTSLQRYIDEPQNLPTEIWQGLIDMGVPALIVPEEFGGLGMELLNLAIIAETLGYAAAPGPLLGHSLCSQALILAGSQQQKEKWLPLLASGEALGSVASAEAGQWFGEELTLSGSSLNGSKQHVPYAEHADLIVIALADNQFALVEKSASGLSISPEDITDRSRPLASLNFANCAMELLPNSSVDAAEKVLNTALILLAADSFGGASRAIDMAVDYAKTREQFGQIIGKFQALKHQLANMAVDVEPMRGLYWHAAYAFDKEPEAASRQAALAKAHLCERYLHVAREAVQAHGGIGYTWECDIQVFLKRALFNNAYMGAPALHRKRAADLAAW